MPLHGINHFAVDSKDNLYVSDFEAGTVWRITPAGVVDARYPYGYQIIGVAVDATGTVYMLNSTYFGPLDHKGVSVRGVYGDLPLW